jgi:hypothetical protein
MRRARKLLIAATLLVVGAWVSWASHTWRFQGDGRLRYRGPLRPSYRLTLPAILSNRTGTYQYRFQGFPSEGDVNFSLGVVGGTAANRREMETLKTRIEVNLTSGDGHQVCGASGVPGGAPWAENQGGRWMLETGPNDANLWHPKCVHFQIHRRDSYTLTINLTDVDSESSAPVLVPTIEGGGSELP